MYITTLYRYDFYPQSPRHQDTVHWRNRPYAVFTEFPHEGYYPQDFLESEYDRQSAITQTAYRQDQALHPVLYEEHFSRLRHLDPFDRPIRFLHEDRVSSDDEDYSPTFRYGPRRRTGGFARGYHSDDSQVS